MNRWLKSIHKRSIPMLELLEDRFAPAVLRIGSWNNANGPNNNADDIKDFTNVVQAIGEQDILGNAKRLDVLSISESDTGSSILLRDIFNGLYPGASYQVIVSSSDPGNDKTGFVYDESTVELIGKPHELSDTLHNVLRARFRPVGTTGSEDFYMYSVHLKSGDGSAEEKERGIEAGIIRADADSLGNGVNIIYSGDFNMNTSDEPAWDNMVAAGNGSAQDLANRPGDWANNPQFIDVHSHATESMKKRFDITMATDELFDGAGLDYIDNSFQVFANKGSHTLGQPISTGDGAKMEILESLEDASDHLPIVADYQFGELTGPDVVLNEIYVNPPSSDDAREYIEIRTPEGATDLTDVWLLEIDGDSTSAGTVDNAQNLGSITTGSNGLLLLGRNYETSHPWGGEVNPNTTIANLEGGSVENGSITFMLVTNFSGSTGKDLDTNNDGILDSKPWGSVLDSVGWTDNSLSDHVYSSAELNLSAGAPDAATRFPGDTASQSANAWYFGDIEGSGTTTTYSSTSISSNAPEGAVITPGDRNFGGVLVLNEFYVNPTGSDDSREYVEIRAGADTKLTDVWLLEIEGDASSAGIIDNAQDLSSLSTGSNGLFLLGRNYTTGHPWGSEVDPATNIGDLEGGAIENGSITFLLVSGFTGTPGKDLDTNNDGKLDSTPWDSILDSVGWDDNSLSDHVYTKVNLDLSGGAPDAATRFPDDTNANSLDAWYYGDITGSGTTTTYDSGSVSSNAPAGAVITPGAENFAGGGLPDAKFYVVDTTADDTYEYQADGTYITNYALASGNTSPRGATSDPSGKTVWVVDADFGVYLYDDDGNSFGSWKAGGISRPEGIATDGTDIWIVDRDADKVFRYAGGASFTSGTHNPTSDFDLSAGAPTGIATDGTSFWVVNSATTDRVYKYSFTGKELGNWAIDTGNGNPTGITIDPNDVDDIWIVDTSSDSVFQYLGGAAHTSGSHKADAEWSLAKGNSSPQGIADPPSDGEEDEVAGKRVRNALKKLRGRNTARSEAVADLFARLGKREEELDLFPG